jgi:hypothetical protein
VCIRENTEPLVARGRPRPERQARRELGEAPARFVGAPPSGGIHAAYGFVCAFTGRDLSAEARIDPRGALLVLGADPLTNDPTLLIPATLDAIHAYERGHLALGHRYNFLVDLERIDPEFLLTLNPIGRLRLPDDPAHYPSIGALTAHLVAFAAGRIPPA